MAFKSGGRGELYPVSPLAAFRALDDVAAWLGFRIRNTGPSQAYFDTLQRERRAIFKRATRPQTGLRRGAARSAERGARRPMNVSREWVAQQTSKASAPVKSGWWGGSLDVFIAGRPTHPLNGTHAHWSKRARWAKTWRENAAAELYKWVLPAPPHLRGWPWTPSAPKRITFTVYGPLRFDDDYLRAVCKPVRDSLQDMAVIDDDRDSSSHVFLYQQAKPTRKAGSVYGISLRVELQQAMTAGIGALCATPGEA